MAAHQRGGLQVEYAVTSRSSCKGCGGVIKQDTMRVGKVLELLIVIFEQFCSSDDVELHLDPLPFCLLLYTSSPLARIALHFELLAHFMHAHSHTLVPSFQETRSDYHDGWDLSWYHFTCCTGNKSGPRFGSIKDLKDWELLRWVCVCESKKRRWEQEKRKRSSRWWNVVLHVDK